MTDHNQKAIEATLLKYIIEENRPFLKEEATDKQRMFYAKLYLTNSTPYDFPHQNQ